MLATLSGWLAGWYILANWRPNLQTTELPAPSTWVYFAVISLSIAAVVWALSGDSQRRTLWFGMMGIGVLAGFLFLYEPNWTPSALLRDFSETLAAQHPEHRPTVARLFLFLALLIGMGAAAWRAKKVQIIPAGSLTLVRHLGAGTVMGLGAALSMGGNDSQLLLALPTLSSAGVLTIIFILLGINLGLDILSKLRT